MTHLCLTGAGPAAGGRSYLLYDQFTTDDDAPVTSPRTCEPKGTLTFTQTDGTFAVTGGKLAFTAQTSPNWGRQGFFGTGVARAAGRTFACALRHSANKSLFLSLSTAANVDYASIDNGFRFSTGNILWANSGGSNAIIGTWAINTDYEMAIVCRATGAFLLFKGGAYTNWTLLWVMSAGTAATLYPQMLNYDGAGTIDNFRVPSSLWVPTPLVSDNFARADSDTVGSSAGGGGEETGGTGIASTEVAGDWDISSNTLVTAGATPANTGFIATWAVGVASVVVQCQVTLQANSVAGIILSSDGTDWVRVAVDDANNVIRIHDYDGVSTYTQRGSTSVTIDASTAYQLVAIRDGANVIGYVDGGSRVAYASESVNATATAHGLASSTAADAFDNLVIWNRTQTLPSF